MSCIARGVNSGLARRRSPVCSGGLSTSIDSSSGWTYRASSPDTTCQGMPPGRSGAGFTPSFGSRRAARLIAWSVVMCIPSGCLTIAPRARIRSYCG
ncbi:hypothetical protein ACQ4WX_43495 [Streptomyces lasalocidi]